MRISNKIQAKNILNTINKTYDKMNNSLAQINTGKAFQKSSEAPYDAIRSMDVSTKIKRLEQYKENVLTAKETMLEIETGLNSIKDSIFEVKDVLSKAMNDTYSAADKESMAQVVDNMKENIIGLLNKEYNGKFIFGGYNTSSEPIQTKGDKVSYNGIDLLNMTEAEYNKFGNEKISLSLGKASSINCSIPAVKITGYGSDNVINILDEISEVLNDNTSTGSDLSPLYEKIDERFNNVINSITSIGAKTVRLDMEERQVEDSKFNLTKLKTEIEGIDIEEAITNFKTAELAYNAALSVGSKIIQPTLLDFLR